MNQTQRDAFELVRAAIRAVDGVFLRLSQRVGALVRRLTTLDRPARRRLLRQIDELLDATFGLTQRAALVSELFATIIRATDAAAERPFLRLLQRVKAAVVSRDPVLWERVRPRLYADIGLGPRVWSLDVDGLLTDEARALNAPAEIREARLQAMQAIRQTSAPERMARSKLLDANRRWVQPGEYRLSDRVWRQGRVVRRNIDSEIRAAIRRGDGPITLASRLEDYLNPELAPVRFLADGRMVREEIDRVTAVSATRRLARTELMRIHGAATIESARTIPGVAGIRWRLSGSHGDVDQCDDNASRSSRGLPRGVYRVDEVPRYPNHPNEMCVLMHEHMPRADVVDLIVKQYGGV